MSQRCKVVPLGDEWWHRPNENLGVSFEFGDVVTSVWVKEDHGMRFYSVRQARRSPNGRSHSLWPQHLGEAIRGLRSARRWIARRRAWKRFLKSFGL